MAVNLAVTDPGKLKEAFKSGTPPADGEEDSGPPFIPDPEGRPTGKVEFDDAAWDDLP